MSETIPQLEHEMSRVLFQMSGARLHGGIGATSRGVAELG